MLPGQPAMWKPGTPRYCSRGHVFFDAPPGLAGADAISFAPLVDHILLYSSCKKAPSGGFGICGPLWESNHFHRIRFLNKNRH